MVTSLVPTVTAQKSLGETFEIHFFITNQSALNEIKVTEKISAFNWEQNGIYYENILKAIQTYKERK